MGRKHGLVFVGTILLMAACSNETKENAFYKEIDGNAEVSHVHGMGFVEEDLLIATHHGLIKNTGGTWYETTENNHDYMGFTVIEEGFYASGHPEEGSNLEDPLGIVKSPDLGETIETVLFEGETDFHLMAASKEDAAIYVGLNKLNSQLSPGFYVTKDEGENWERLMLDGWNGASIDGMAVHPTDGDQVAFFATDGIYHSKDAGATFRYIEGSEGATGVTFTEDELIFAADQEVSSVDLNTMKVKSLGTGELAEPILYLAVHPAEEDVMWAATEDGKMIKSSDGGASWEEESL